MHKAESFTSIDISKCDNLNSGIENNLKNLSSNVV